MITCAGCPLRNTGIKEFLFPFSKFSLSQKVRLIISQSAPPPAWLQGETFPKRLWNLQLRGSGPRGARAGNLQLLDNLRVSLTLYKEEVYAEQGWQKVVDLEFGQTYETQFGQTYWDTETLRKTQYSWLVWYFFLPFLEDQKKKRDLKLLQPVTTNSTSSLQQQGPVHRQKRAGRQVTIKALLNGTIKSLPIVTYRAYSDY